MKEKEKILTNNWAVCAIALICCLLWGSAFPCIKIGYRLFAIEASDTASQIVFAGVRFTLAGILTILIGSALGRTWLIPGKGSASRILCLCLLQTVIQYFFFYVGLAHTTGVKSSIIEATNVFAAILVSSLIFHYEKLESKKIIGCLIGFAGVVLINLGGKGMDGGLQLTGEGFIFLSAISYAFSSVMIKKFSEKENPVTLSGYQFVVGGMILSVVGALLGGRLSGFNVNSVALLLYMAFISAAAYSLWGILLKYNPVGKVAVFGFMNPVFGVILSAVLLGEQNQAFTIRGLLSLLLVCVGIYIVNKK